MGERENFSLGEEIDLKLVVENSGLEQQISTEKVQLTGKINFSSYFSVIPLTEGQHNFGPYSMQYEGRTLTSNIVVVNVKKSLQSDMEIQVSETKIKVGTQVQVKVVSTKTGLKDVKLKSDSNFTIIGQSKGSKMEMKNGKKVIEEYLSFKVEFNKSGKYTIDKSWFIGLPEYFRLEEVAITVK